MNEQPMTAAITKPVQENGRWMDGKEQVEALAVVAYENGEFRQPVTARLWMARSGDGMRPLYCTVWASRHGVSVSGHGKASGCGYHKASAALQAALDSAGVKLSEAIDGRGERAMEDALGALAYALGYRNYTVVRL